MKEETEAQEEDEHSTPLDKTLIVQLQLSEYHHIQSMARGLLAITLAVAAIAIAGISAFYYPIPSIPTSPTDYQPIIDSSPVSIPVSIAIFTVNAGGLQSIVVLILAMISLGTGLTIVLDLLIPRGPFVSSLYSRQSDVEIEQIVDENREALQVAQEKYTRAALRLLIAIILGANVFLLWSFAESLRIWSLLWIQLWHLIPATLVSKGLRRVINTDGSDGPSDRPLLLEAVIDEGQRIEYFNLKSYETWIWRVFTGISLLILLFWSPFILDTVVSIL